LNRNDCIELAQSTTILNVRGWNEVAVRHWKAKLGWVENTVISVSENGRKTEQLENGRKARRWIGQKVIPQRQAYTLKWFPAWSQPSVPAGPRKSLPWGWPRCQLDSSWQYSW
jgi:hypothetical protein